MGMVRAAVHFPEFKKLVLDYACERNFRGCIIDYRAALVVVGREFLFLKAARPVFESSCAVSEEFVYRTCIYYFFRKTAACCPV